MLRDKDIREIIALLQQLGLTDRAPDVTLRGVLAFNSMSMGQLMELPVDAKAPENAAALLLELGAAGTPSTRVREVATEMLAQPEVRRAFLASDGSDSTNDWMSDCLPPSPPEVGTPEFGRQASRPHTRSGRSSRTNPTPPLN